MSYISKNEIGQFDFSDCQITNVEKSQDGLIFTLDSLIVLENNSQNSNYTKSYADTTVLRLTNSSIESVVIAGYKVYDANDNLVEQIEDKLVPALEYDSVLAKIKDSYLYRVIKVSDDDALVYDFEVEEIGDGGSVDLRNDTYVLRIKFDEASFTWEKYLNRVQSN